MVGLDKEPSLTDFLLLCKRKRGTHKEPKSRGRSGTYHKEPGTERYLSQRAGDGAVLRAVPGWLKGRMNRMASVLFANFPYLVVIVYRTVE